MDSSSRKISVSSDKSPKRIPNLDPLSPGPMTLSELQSPPTKLQSIEKQTKPRRTSRSRAEERQPGTTEVDSAALNKMRARLDPFYNRPLPSISANQFPDHTPTEPPASTISRGDQLPSGQSPPSKRGTPLNAPQDENLQDSTSEALPKRRKTSRRRVKTVERLNDEESNRSTSAASIMTEERCRRTSSAAPDQPQQGAEVNNKASPNRYVTCTVETVTNMASNDPDAEVRVEPRGSIRPNNNSNSPEHSVDVRPLPVLPPSLDTPPPTLSQSPNMPEGASQSTHTRQQLGRSGDPMLLVSDEDIVEESLTAPTTAPTGDFSDTGAVLTLGIGTRQPPRSTGVVYVEKEDGNGFVAKKPGTHERPDSRGGTSTLIASLWGQGVTSTKFALSLHTLIQRFILSLQGLLAGLSLWDCVVAGVLSREGSGHLNLLQQYGSLTLPLHTIHLLILLPLATSMLDRIDTLRPSKQCALSFMHRPVQMVFVAALLLVFLALVFTVSLASIDERIQLYSVQPDLWTDIVTIVNATSSGMTAPTGTYVLNAHPVSSKLTAWLVLSILRAVCCLLGWMIMSWFTKYDRLREYLHAVDERCKTPPASSEPTHK